MLRLKVSIPARASLYSSECYPRTPTTPCPAGLSRTRSCPATPRQLFAIQIHHKAAISRKWRWRSDQFGRMFDPFIMQHFTPLPWTNAAGASMTACKRDVQTREGDRANKHAWECCCWHLLVKRLLEFCLQLIEFNATLPAICAAGLEKRTTTSNDIHKQNVCITYSNQYVYVGADHADICSGSDHCILQWRVGADQNVFPELGPFTTAGLTIFTCAYHTSKSSKSRQHLCGMRAAQDLNLCRRWPDSACHARLGSLALGGAALALIEAGGSPAPFQLRS